MRRFAVVLALLLAVAACGDDDGSNLIPATSASSPTVATSTASTAGTAAPTASTVGSQVSGGPTDCLDVWPEAVVQTVTGSELTFFEANADRSACVYLGLPSSVALGWRSGDLADFEMGRGGAAAVSGAADIAVCDTGYYTELEGAGVIMEAHSSDKGRTYTATVTGLSIDDARDWAAALLGSAC